MKNKVKPLCQTLLFITFLFIHSNQLLGQEKVNISAGISLPELLNVAVRYQFKQAQLGISVGSLPLRGRSLTSVSGDVFYHFGGFSELSRRRPLYGRIGLNYFREKTERLFDKSLLLNIRIGRDCNISKRFGIDIDTGLFFRLFHEETTTPIKPSSGWNLNFDFAEPSVIVLPSLGIGLFYRI